MVLDDWELEMNRMLDAFANQATFSLRKINRRFNSLGRPFDEKFRQHFLKMSNLRLDMSFNAVVFSEESADHDGTENRTNVHNSAPSINPLKREEVDRGNIIEICDSDNESRSETQATIDLTGGCEQTNVKNELPEPSRNGTESNNEVDVSPSVADVSTINSENTEGVVIQIRDANNDINSGAKSSAELNTNSQTIECGNGRRSSDNDSNSDNANKAQNGKSRIQQAKSSTSTGSSGVKRFKCKHCSKTFKFKSNFEKHLRIHAIGKLIELKESRKKLFHCKLCIRQFTENRHLIRHLKSHKTDQYLYNCARCMRQFTQKVEKDSHEPWCQGRHYECHLCKVYVSMSRSDMQKHMQTHSGEKPFRCMICDKSFNQTGDLKIHLNRVHAQM